MKKIMAALAALMLLTACSAEKTPVEQPVQPQNPVVKEPVTVTPEAVPEEPDELQYTTQRLEGLVEDTVAYIYDYPQFDQPEINQFYTDLMTTLEEYAKSTVYTTAIDRHTIADVTGSFDVIQPENTVCVTYTVTVEFGDGETESFDRTDTFDLVTGQLMEE